MTDTDATYETKADLMGTIPITLFLKSGTLRLANGRLSFTRSRNRLIFDAPVHEFHSPAINSFGFMIWHGPKRYRMVIGQTYNAAAVSGNPVLAIAALPDVIDDMRDARAGAAQWVTELGPLCGPVPSGVKVAKPWRVWQTLAVVIGGTFLVCGAIIAIALIAAS